MSQYATAAEFKARALNPAAVSGISDQQIEDFISEASADADIYLRSRYLQSGPLVSWGPDLRSIVLHMAALKLLDWRGRDPNNPADLAVEESAARALGMLKDIQNDRGSLDVEMTLPSASPMPRVSSQPRRGW